MFKKSKMDIIAGLFILIGTAFGIWANIINKKDVKTLEETKNKLALELIERNQEILELNKKFDRYAEEMKFFNSVNFSYIKDIAFPIGFTVFRQNKSFENFKRVFGDKLFYEQFDMKIIETSPGKFSIQMYNLRILPHQKNSIQISGEDATITRDEFNPYLFNELQVFNEIQLIPNMVTAVLMIDDGYEYTFAVGFTPKDIDLYLKTQKQKI